MDETKRRHSLRRCVAALCAMLFFAFALGASTVRALGEEAVRVVPVGRAVGVKLFADGVLVVGLSDGETAAKDIGLREGDILLTFNGTQIDSSEHLRKLIAENGDARATLNVQRGAKMLSLDVTPQRDAEGACHLGAWIRDSMAGIGTMLSTITMSTRSKDVLLAVLFIPLIYPLLYACVTATTAALTGSVLWTEQFLVPLALAGGYDVIMILICWVLYDFVISA